MVRPSKRQQFAIWQDADTRGMQTPHLEPSTQPEQDDTSKVAHSFHNDDHFHEDDDNNSDDGEDTTLEDIHEDYDVANIQPTDTETEDVRRESAITTASISSFPESSLETDIEHSLPIFHNYSSPMTRPSFRRLDLARRMQMSSPIAHERSPRRQVIYSKSRSGTLRSVRASAKGSPLHKRHLSEEEVEEERKQYPLVLLHVTLLPVKLRWSPESLREILPATMFDNLQMLRSKVSETVAQRGILMPHPHEEYDVLEERLLEALELKQERITKCGHFRARDSTSSTSSATDSIRSGDSGIGSSVEGNECLTCHERVKSNDIGVGTREQKWSIKVFAANGLMRASAWSAAWSEMESVDVEILPWITEDLRKQLDARLLEEETDARRLDEDARIRRIVEEEVRIAHEHQTLMHEEQRRAQCEDTDRTSSLEQVHEPISPTEVFEEYLRVGEPPQEQVTASDLPQIYRSKDIPLSLLLKNYIVLLAKDKRNLVIFAMSVLAFALTLRMALAPAAADFGLAPTTLNDSARSSPIDSASTGQTISDVLNAIGLSDVEANENENVLVDQLPDSPSGPSSERASETIGSPGSTTHVPDVLYASAPLITCNLLKQDTGQSSASTAHAEPEICDNVLLPWRVFSSPQET